MICPYCEVEISMSAVDAEDGFCPECGAAIAPSSILPSEDDMLEDDMLEDDEEILDPFDEDLDEDL